jgi:hypothetical protein
MNSIFTTTKTFKSDNIPLVPHPLSIGYGIKWIFLFPEL